LFLGAGSVIHAVHTNDIQEMGGLRTKQPRTAMTFMIASLAIAGIFPLSGFWSKDEIVATTAHHPLFFVLTLTIAFMTAFYMWRLCFLTFFGEPRNKHRFDHAHESPGVMTWPLVFLAVLSVCAGWVALPWLEHGFSSFVYHGEPHHAEPEYFLMILSTLVSVSGIGLAWLMYYRKAISADLVADRLKPVYTLLYNKYYFDELYDFIIVRPVLAISNKMWSFDATVVDGAVNGTAWLTVVWSDAKQWFDATIVDGAVNGAGWLVRQGAAGLRYIQSGAVQFYALFIAGLIVVIGMYRFEIISAGSATTGLITFAFVLGLVVLWFVSRSIWKRSTSSTALDPEENSVRVEDK